MSDSLGDLCARIKNALLAKKYSVDIPFSVEKGNILKVLTSEGFVEGYEIKQNSKGFDCFSVALRYYNGMPAIKHFKRISKPGRRVYSSISNLKQSLNGLGVIVLSTPKGVLADHEARELKVGGELLYEIY